MRMVDGQTAQDFPNPAELLYRRCHPNHLDPNANVLEPAVKEHNLSVLRAIFAEPDDARWESEADCHEDRPPQVYPEFFVIELPVSAVPTPKVPDKPGVKGHSFHAVHVPFSDNYAHSEIRIHRDGTWAKKEHDLDSAESKAAKKMLRTKLADAARVRLQPFEGATYTPPT